MNKPAQHIVRRFREISGEPSVVVRSPGRVNLIGDHTDYNEGFVLPAAIDRSVFIALSPNRENRLRAHALDMENSDFEADLAGEITPSGKGWPDYLLGVIHHLRKAGYTVPGFDCVIGGDIPIGAGLSSSAALEGGVIYALDRIGGYGMSGIEMARMGQVVEHTFANVNCGIMDQYANLYGEKNKLIKLDCRSLEHETIPFIDGEYRILLCDTRVHRELAGSEYNIRRKQCEEAVAFFAREDDPVTSLRDLLPERLERHREELSPVVYRRARFVLEENRRVVEACNDLKQENMAAFGKKMYESHEGLRNLYEVSCPELDFLVKETESMDAVRGARMMGGGFGGCTINLVKKEEVDRVAEHLARRYRDVMNISLNTHIVQTADGTSVLNMEDIPVSDEYKN